MDGRRATPWEAQGIVHSNFPVAVHVLPLRGEEVLLLRRSNTGYEDGKLSVVAGHVEPGETVTQSAVRETREEVGLELSRERLRVVGVMHRMSKNETGRLLSGVLARQRGINSSEETDFSSSPTQEPLLVCLPRPWLTPSAT